MDHGAETRPPSRPSRRHDLIQAALDLFASRPWDQVTVTSIVETAGMTVTAFYYHFASREQLLDEIVQGFADDWVARGRELLTAAQAPRDIAAAVSTLLDWIGRDRQRATIYFLNSVGASLISERIRRDARRQLAAAAAEAIARTTNRRESAAMATDGQAVLVVCEVAARCELSRDEPYRVLGPRAFRAEVAQQVTRVIGVRAG